jgi:hypothetical protein
MIAPAHLMLPCLVEVAPNLTDHLCAYPDHSAALIGTGHLHLCCMVSKAEQLDLYLVHASCVHSLAQHVHSFRTGVEAVYQDTPICLVRQRGCTASGQTCPTDHRVQQDDALGARLDL